MSKQRLIDANALAHILESCRDTAPVLGLQSIIAVDDAIQMVIDSPTIDAIPVSWLREKMDGYAAKLRSTELAALVTVMQMWEQEGR